MGRSELGRDRRPTARDLPGSRRSRHGSLDEARSTADHRLMWGTFRRLARPVIAVSIVGLVSACAAIPFPSPSPEAVEQMPGPASVWLTSDPATPVSPVDVAMTVPGDPGVLFAHTFPSGAPLRGDFATSQGPHVLSALGGACGLRLDLGASEEAQVLLTVADDGTCTLAVTWRGSWDAADWPKHGEGVFITNHNVGDATPRIEGGG